MALSQADVDALETAIATGTLQVRYADGSSVTYRSQTELERALLFVQRRVAAAAPGAAPSRSFVGSY